MSFQEYNNQRRDWSDKTCQDGFSQLRDGLEPSSETANSSKYVIPAHRKQHHSTAANNQSLHTTGSNIAKSIDIESFKDFFNNIPKELTDPRDIESFLWKEHNKENAKQVDPRFLEHDNSSDTVPKYFRNSLGFVYELTPKQRAIEAFIKTLPQPEGTMSSKWSTKNLQRHEQESKKAAAESKSHRKVDATSMSPEMESLSLDKKEPSTNKWIEYVDQNINTPLSKNENKDPHPAKKHHSNQTPSKPTKTVPDWISKAQDSIKRYSKNQDLDQGNSDNHIKEGASSRWKQLASEHESANKSRSHSNHSMPYNGYLHPDDRNKYQKRVLFAPFISPTEMESGVNRGTLYEGILRVSKNRQDAYVTSDALDYDIYIGGMVDRNRALSGDQVAVELLDVDQIWELKKTRDLKRQEDRKKMKAEREESNPDNVPEKLMEEEPHLDDKAKEDELMDSDEEDHKPKYCGRIVGILTRTTNTTFSGTIGIDRISNKKPQDDSNNQERRKDLRLAWFKPSDKKIPLIALRNADIPRDLVDNEDYYKSHIFSVQIIRWQITDLNPTGRVVAAIGPVGELKAEKGAILADNSIINTEFSEMALQCLPETPWSIPEREYEKRRDLRSFRVFSIDPKTAKDLDDALHIQPLKDGYFEVGVHIADVSYFLKRNSTLDSEARERATSTYLVDSVIPMLPPLLCEELCSLNPGVERLAFSVIWKMDREGNAVDTWFGRTIIKSCAKLAYEDAQDVIEGGLPKSDVEVFNDEDIFYLCGDIRRLHKLSVEMRKRRYNNGCLSLHSVKLNFNLDDNGNPIGVYAFEAKEANRLIEEFMLFANISVAQKISQSFPNEALLRRHEGPVERRLDEFIKITDVLGLHFNGNSAGELQESFNRLNNQTVKDVMLVLAIRCMQKAKYFCSGSLDISKFSHYALSEDLYTHFTSPIRRYADVMVHRLLEAALLAESNPNKEKVAPYNKKMVQKVALACNGKKEGAKNAQDEDGALYLAKYLEKMEQESGPIYKKATVIVVGKQTFDIYVPEYGLEKRVHMDGLPVEKFDFDKSSLALDIYWKRGVPVTMHNEEKMYAQERIRPDDYSDDEEVVIEYGEREAENSLEALALQEPKEYNFTINPNDLIPPVIQNPETCMQTLKMFSVIDVRIQVNCERSPPIINLYPVNPF